MSWKYIETLKKKYNDEICLKNYNFFGKANNYALCFPNNYNVAMANLGFQVIYDRINTHNDFACERFFLPDKDELKDLADQGPLSIENQRNLNQFDIIGFSISFELDYCNILWFLDKSKIPYLSKDRDESYPLIMAGGPCMTFNPMPMAAFIDLVVVGEGEEIISEILDVYNSCKDFPKLKILEALSHIQGVFVPVIHNESKKSNFIKVRKGIVADLDSHPCASYILSPHMEFSDMFLIEISRGCGRNCKFCMAGYCYRNPRIRTIESILNQVKEAKSYRNKIGLVGAAISDYPQIDLLVEELRGMGMMISVASLRADSLTKILVENLAYSQHQTITIAPEGGSERIREYINKGISERDVINAVQMAFEGGIPNVRLYFMIGFPGEEEKDIKAIIDLALKIKEMQRESNLSHKKVTLSINPFIPKPFTPFQWSPMDSIKSLNEKIKFINNGLKGYGGIDITYENPKEAKIQSFLARGGHDISSVILYAYENSMTYGAWKKGAKLAGYDLESTTEGQRSYNDILPWDILDVGIAKELLIKMMDKSLEVLYNG